METPKRPRDVNELAAEIARDATQEDGASEAEQVPEPDAVTFGREGGKKRASRMTSEERSAAARKAVQARWDKHKP